MNKTEDNAGLINTCHKTTSQVSPPYDNVRHTNTQLQKHTTEKEDGAMRLTARQIKKR